jgi:hypothetical protein
MSELRERIFRSQRQEKGPLPDKIYAYLRNAEASGSLRDGTGQEMTVAEVAEYQPIRLSMLASDRRAMHATREQYMRTRPPRAGLRQPRHKPPDQAA